MGYPLNNGVYVWPLDVATSAFGHAWLAGRERRFQWNEYARLCPDGRQYQSKAAYMIYALCEPETGEIRYIGITSSAKERLGDHNKDRVATRQAWLAQLRQQGQKPPMKRLALAYGPRCFAEQHEKAWIRVLFAHGCDLLNNEALLGPRAFVFRAPLSQWDERTSLYLEDGIPAASPHDLQFYVCKEAGGGAWGCERYTKEEYATFHYRPTLERDRTGLWRMPGEEEGLSQSTYFTP